MGGAPPLAASAALAGGRSLQLVMPRRDPATFLRIQSGSPSNAAINSGVFTAYVCPYNGGATAVSVTIGTLAPAF